MLYHAQTIEQFRIKKWLEANFAPDALRQVELLTRNSVRVTDRNYDTALVVCRPNGTVALLDDVEAC